MKLILLCGVSGAGKSVAIKALEDVGFYCIDHLPSEVLIPTLNAVKTKNVEKVAIGLEINDAFFVKNAQHQIDALEKQGFEIEIVVLTAKNDILQQRYFESRRPHPLSHMGLSTEQAISLELKASRLIPRGAHVIDTSFLKPAELSVWIQKYALGKEAKMTIVLKSFGFKHGVPNDCDLLFDARCLPNPYYDISLRPLNGGDKEVIEFFENLEIVDVFYKDICTYLQKWYDTYALDNRKCLHVGIGCTGGQHRSVYVVNKVNEYLSTNGLDVKHLHREKETWHRSH